MVKLIGHRGAKGEEPENTLLGMKTAILAGADGVEIDVMLSKDGTVVVMHDDTVDRTTNGKGRVIDMTFDELRKLDTGKGEKIPTLQEVLDLIKRKNNEVFIELKTWGAEEQVVQLIEKNNMFKTAIVKSFNHRIITRVKELNSKIKTACLIVGLPVHAYRIVKDAQANILSINSNNVDKELIDECHKHNYQVYVWNIDDQKEVQKFIDMGADYIGTNYPSTIKL